MALSRQNDEMLDSMKSFADRLVRERQKAWDATEHYKRQLQDCEGLRQQLLDEVSSSSRLIAAQSVRIQEGDCNLQKLRDKLKVSDAYQRTLQEQLAVLEGSIVQCNTEQLAVKEAFTVRVAGFQSSVNEAITKIKEQKFLLAEHSQQLELVSSELREQEKCTEEAVQNAHQQESSFAAEKEQLLNRLHVSNKDCKLLDTQLKAEQLATSKSQAQLESDVRKLKQQIETLHNQIDELNARSTMEKEELRSTVHAAQAQSKQKEEQLTAQIEALLLEKDKLLGDSLGREWELQQKVEEVSQSLSELSSQHASDMEAFEAFKESSEAAILAKQEEVGKLETAVKESILAAKSCEERSASVEESMKADIAASRERICGLEGQLKEQEKKYWDEKEKLKRLQDNFAEQYERLVQCHAKEIQVLQTQADQHVKEIERLAAEAQQKHDCLTETQATVAMLEAAKVAATALHSAQLADAVATTAGAVCQERETAAAREKALLDANSDLKTELEGCKDAAAEAQRRHEAVLAELQGALTGTLEEVKRQQQELAKKDADLVELAARKQRELDELSRAHEAAIAQMQQDREQAAALSAKEAERLAEHVAVLEGKLADALKQLTGKEENLDSMRSQARMRENRLSELAADLEAKEELLKCISSAAATVKKTPAKIKPRPMAAVAQPSRFADQEQLHRKRAGSKKRRLVGAADENADIDASQGIQNLRQHQQQQQRLASKAGVHGRRSGKSIFSSMSAEPVHNLQPTSAARLFGTDIANPYAELQQSPFG